MFTANPIVYEGEGWGTPRELWSRGSSPVGEVCLYSKYTSNYRIDPRDGSESNPELPVFTTCYSVITHYFLIFISFTPRSILENPGPPTEVVKFPVTFLPGWPYSRKFFCRKWWC